MTCFKDLLKDRQIEEGTLVGQYISWLDEMIPECGAAADAEGPFLSVITRTQGKRPDMLRETLLSLTAQSDEDFEVLVMGHNVTDEQAETVQGIIDELPCFIHERVHLHRVEGGGRSRPLNEGFLKATGKYAVILDDDDLVYNDWVESFKLAYEKAPGSMLHAYSFAQVWSETKTEDGSSVLRSERRPITTYCRDFNWLTQMEMNCCPTLGIAFPTVAFQKWNFRFDETLDTTEDWDCIMRVAAICGVSDVPNITGLYRLWANAQNSHTLHDEELWETNHEKIRRKMEMNPVLMPAGYSRVIQNMVSSDGSNLLWTELEGALSGKPCSLYLDTGKGFNEAETISNPGTMRNKHFSYTYDLPVKSLRQIRWDPAEKAGIMLQNIEIHTQYNDGHLKKHEIYSLMHNGRVIDNKLCFFARDPQIIIPGNEIKGAVRLFVTGDIEKDIPDELILKVMNGGASQKLKGLAMKVKKKLKGI